jgi:hypothetical protein
MGPARIVVCQFGALERAQLTDRLGADRRLSVERAVRGQQLVACPAPPGG